MGPVKQMLDLGINVSLNTDDPSEFASRHMTHMMSEVLNRSAMTNDDMVAFMRNAFDAAWIGDEQYVRRFLDLRWVVVSRLLANRRIGLDEVFDFPGADKVGIS